MIEMLTETYQDLFIYSSYVFVLLYLLIFIYKQWSQIHTSQYPLKNIDTFLVIGDPNLTNQAINRLDIFLLWLPKTIRRKESSSAEKKKIVFSVHFVTADRYFIVWMCSS